MEEKFLFTNSQKSFVLSQLVYPRCFPWGSSYLHCEWRLTLEMKLKKIIIHISVTWSLQVKRTDSSIIVLKIFHLKIFASASGVGKNFCLKFINPKNCLLWNNSDLPPIPFHRNVPLDFSISSGTSLRGGPSSFKVKDRMKTHTHRARTAAPVLHSLSELCEGWSWSILC